VTERHRALCILMNSTPLRVVDVKVNADTGADVDVDTDTDADAHTPSIFVQSTLGD